MSKFDIILLFCFGCNLLVVGMEFYLRLNGLEGFGAGLWTYETASTTGEIVMFSLYQIVKEKQGKIPKTMRAQHAYINELEEDNGE